MNTKPDEHNSTFRRMDTGEKLLFRISGMGVPEGKKREDVLAELKKKIAESEVAKYSWKRTPRIIIWTGSIAATILILLGLIKFLPSTGSTKIIAKPGTHSEYFLPDGSDVKLNADSRISFKQSRFNERRNIELKGEAFFSVPRHGEFNVITANGDISVAGTTFNVCSRDNLFKVTCYTGKVIVTANKHTVTLIPGESAETENGMLKVFKDSKAGSISGWINGDFYFENTPLIQVFNEVERQFNVKFVTKIKEDKLYYTGGFSNNDLNEALELICLPMKLDYQIESKNKISVSYKE
jgi:ferric-dicitrate binding protein FerR (iron transport regulator)